MTDEREPDLSRVASPPRRDLSYDDLEPTGRLGSGGEAVVRAARVPGGEPPETVALREPTTGPDTVDRATVERFLDAVGTWRTLDDRERERRRWADSEFVVGIVASGDRTPWVAMEYMDGGSLAERLEEHPDGLPLAEACWYGECVARGVEIAHQNGVAHLDLKPGNVLFRRTPEGQWDVPKIADWGLARALLDEQHTVERFSPQYAAPEQFDRESYGDPDTLTDVYAVGAVLYALLTGDSPYDGPRASVMHGVLSPESPAPPSEHRPEVPPELDDLVLAALATGKTERPRSVGSLVERLASIREAIGRAYDDRDQSGGREPPSDRDGRDLRTSLALSLAEAFSGASKQLSIRRSEPCPDCDGTGGVAGAGSARDGRRSRDCSACDGDGAVVRERTVELEVPAGVETGQTLRLAGEGERGRGQGSVGDLFVEVEVEDDPRFERDGPDLYHDLGGDPEPGTTVTVPTPDGSVQFELPEGAEAGQVFRLQDRGLPRLRGEGHGDLYVEYGDG
jgi:curved DNA-binding protein CbpA